jgi:hypothetical protein
MTPPAVSDRTSVDADSRSDRSARASASAAADTGFFSIDQ